MKLINLELDFFDFEKLKFIVDIYSIKDTKTFYKIFKRNLLLKIDPKDIYKVYHQILELLDDEEMFKVFINDPRLDFICKNTIFQSTCKHGHLKVFLSMTQE